MRLRTTVRTRRSYRSSALAAQGDLNANVALNLGERKAQKQGGKTMAEKRAEEPRDDMSREELEAQGGEALPDREAMSLVNANLALPINAAVAANVLSDGSIAYADANQADQIAQGAGATSLPTAQ
jgi:hypothetical protein